MMDWSGWFGNNFSKTNYVLFHLSHFIIYFNINIQGGDHLLMQKTDEKITTHTELKKLSSIRYQTRYLKDLKE